MCRKMDKTIHGNCACIQPPFSAYRTQLKRKPSAPFERAYNTGLGSALRFYIYFVFAHDFYLWRTWEYIRIGMHLCVPHIQTVKDILK